MHLGFLYSCFHSVSSKTRLVFPMFNTKTVTLVWKRSGRSTPVSCLFPHTQVLDREGQMDNPCTTWLADAYWDNITELDKLTNFHGLMNSFEQYPRDWHLWYTNATPEKAMLPGARASEPPFPAFLLPSIEPVCLPFLLVFIPLCKFPSVHLPHSGVFSAGTPLCTFPALPDSPCNYSTHPQVSGRTPAMKCSAC